MVAFKFALKNPVGVPVTTSKATEKCDLGVSAAEMFLRARPICTVPDATL
jgi:hypothetical protein